MITPEDVRRMALALPETTEGTHFRMPAFQVRGKNFAGLERGGTHATLALAESDVDAALAEDPAAIEPVRRSGKPIGVRVDLAKVTPERFASLTELAWRHKAPRQLVASFDQRR